MVRSWGCAVVPKHCVRGCGPVSSLRRHVTGTHGSRRRTCRILAQANETNEDDPEHKSRANALTGTIKRKQRQLADLMQEIGMESLEDRLQSATASPANPPHRFAQLIQVTGDSPAQ